MIAVFVIGLWATIRLGQSLRAPHDISGKWSVVSADAHSTTPKAFAVSQSGRFVKLTIDGSKPVDLSLTSDEQTESGRRMVFSGNGQELAVETPADAKSADRVHGTHQFHFRGPIDGVWPATRDERTDTGKRAGAPH